MGNTKSLGCFLMQCTEVRNTRNRIGLGQKTDLVSPFRMRYERHGFREALSLDLGFRREVCNAMVLIFLARSDHRPFENRTKIFFPPKKNVASHSQDFVYFLRGFTYFLKDTLPIKNFSCRRPETWEPATEAEEELMEWLGKQSHA